MGHQWDASGTPVVKSAGNHNSQKYAVRLCRVPLEFLNHPGMLADGTYLVPDDLQNFRDDPRDVRQASEPAYCADLTTGAPLVPHFSAKNIRLVGDAGVWRGTKSCWRMLADGPY